MTAGEVGSGGVIRGPEFDAGFLDERRRQAGCLRQRLDLLGT
jgi:hypothetical protein